MRLFVELYSGLARQLCRIDNFMYKTTKILITGSNGFIGKNLVEYLAEKQQYKLFYPCHAELELLDTVKVENFVNSHDIDVIVHCANVGGSRKTDHANISREEICYKNLRMFFNLSRLAERGRRLITLGSGAEYGHDKYIPKMTEEYSQSNVPEDAYGFSKYICSQYVMQSQNMIVLRFFGCSRLKSLLRFISNAMSKYVKSSHCNQSNVYFDF